MHHMQEQNDKRLVLKSASDMLLELSSNQNPKSYSSLYAEVFGHLQQLSVRSWPAASRVQLPCCVPP